VLVVIVCIIRIIGKPNGTRVVLHQVRDIPLTGGTNRFDYQSIDTSTNRLYISHLGSNMVDVFDVKMQKVITNIPIVSIHMVFWLFQVIKNFLYQ
jgi:hypothetical protein